MNYGFSKTITSDFDQAVARVTDELKKEGFGVLTEIDLKEILKKKLDVDFKKYKILGACNPQYAYRALQQEDKVGLMLPCNVVVEDAGNGQVEVSAVDPVASMQAISNANLAGIAMEVSERLQRVISNI